MGDSREGRRGTKGRGGGVGGVGGRTQSLALDILISHGAWKLLVVVLPPRRVALEPPTHARQHFRSALADDASC